MLHTSPNVSSVIVIDEEDNNQPPMFSFSSADGITDYKDIQSQSIQSSTDIIANDAKDDEKKASITKTIHFSSSTTVVSSNNIYAHHLPLSCNINTIVKQEARMLKDKELKIAADLTQKKAKKSLQTTDKSIEIQSCNSDQILVTTATSKILEDRTPNNEQSLPILEQAGKVLPNDMLDNASDHPSIGYELPIDTASVMEDNGISITDPNGRIHTIPYNVIPTTKPLQGGYAIFVGNLDEHTHEDIIREKLEFYGINISSMTAKKPSTKQTSYPMFYLFVNLTSPEDVVKAVDILNNQRIGTSVITVSARDNDKQKIQTGSRIIHIGNMPQEYSGEPLVHMLSRMGIHLNESDFKLLRNHAFIRLLNKDSTLEVLSELQLSINRMYRSDRKITVEIARSDPWMKSKIYIQSSTGDIIHINDNERHGHSMETKIKSDLQKHNEMHIVMPSNRSASIVDKKPLILSQPCVMGDNSSSMIVLQMPASVAQIQAQMQIQAQAQLQAQVQIQAAHYNLQLQHQKQQYLQQLYGVSTAPMNLPHLLYFQSLPRANVYHSAYGNSNVFPQMNVGNGNVSTPTNIPISGIHNIPHLYSVPYTGLRSVQPSVLNSANSVNFLNPLPFHAHGMAAASRFNPLSGNRIF